MLISRISSYICLHILRQYSNIAVHSSSLINVLYGSSCCKRCVYAWDKRDLVYTLKILNVLRFLVIFSIYLFISYLFIYFITDVKLKLHWVSSNVYISSIWYVFDSFIFLIVGLCGYCFLCCQLKLLFGTL